METCKQYKQFEQETLQRVTEARGRVQDARMEQNIPALGQAETALRAGLGGIFATVEAYPELKTNETFQHLLARITGLENSIADRREFYNESVNVNNVAIEQFPELVIANLFRFDSFALLRFSENEKKDRDVKALFRLTAKSAERKEERGKRKEERGKRKGKVIKLASINARGK